MGDLHYLAIFAASKFFNLGGFYNKYIYNTRRHYSYDGMNIYDFNRKGYARIFPIENNINQFSIFDFVNGNYLTVTRTSKDKIGVVDHASDKEQFITI